MFSSIWDPLYYIGLKGVKVVECGWLVLPLYIIWSQPTAGSTIVFQNFLQAYIWRIFANIPQICWLIAICSTPVCCCSVCQLWWLFVVGHQISVFAWWRLIVGCHCWCLMLVPGCWGVRCQVLAVNCWCWLFTTFSIVSIQLFNYSMTWLFNHTGTPDI
jgi:hypothetical protein